MILYGYPILPYSLSSLPLLLFAPPPLPLSPLLELEWMLSEKGVLKTDLEEDPRKKHQIRDVMSAAMRSGYIDPEDSDDSD